MGQALTRIMISMGEQKNIFQSKLETAAHDYRENPRDEMSHNRQEVSKKEKARTDQYLVRSLSRMIREA